MSTATQDAPAVNALAIKSDPKALAYKNLLDNERFRSSLMGALPKHIKAEHFIRVTLSAMSRQPKLYECTPESVLLSLMRAASCGLEPDGGVLGQGYLVPYWNSKISRNECQFIPGYRGLIKLARNSGEVADVWAEVVYEKDRFEYELGLEPRLKHKRNDDDADAGQPKYAYAVARFRDGERKFIVMNKREIEKVRSSSASKDRSGQPVGPWKDWPEEMWKKTAVRRLCKMLPLSVDIHQQIESEDHGAATLDTSMVAAIPLDLQSLPDESSIDVPEPVDVETQDITDAEPATDWHAQFAEFCDLINKCTTQPEVNAIYREWLDRKCWSEMQSLELHEAADARKQQIKSGAK